MRVLLLLVALGSAISMGQEHTHQHETPVADDSQIVISINPEARVSAVLAAPLPAPVACGSPTEVKIKVLNQGFVTAPLRTAIVGDDVSGVLLQTNDEKLSGHLEDNRTLRVTSPGPDPVDITIAFSIDKNVGDLGGRDRVHLLLRCTNTRAVDDRAGSRFQSQAGKPPADPQRPR